MDDLLTEFLSETSESLAALDTALVKLEQTPDDKPTLSLIFRMVHTIKGTCGFLGLGRLERVAHAGEDVLGRVRDGTLAATPDIVSVVLAALDRIKEILAALSVGGAEPAGDDAPLIAALKAAAAGEAASAGSPAPAISPPEVAAPAIAPGEAALTEISRPELAAAENSGPAEAVVAADAGGQTIRVAVPVLEELMTLVSELVLTRNQLLQLARTDGSTAYAAPLQRLSQITSDLQEGVMKTRMQPIATAWSKLPRLVRDLARDLGKKIDLTMRGAETELDRQVLELIRDPLTHMVRNSCDHGLETTADRRAAGKPETGRIILNAFHEGGHIVIEIGDDGRGLPVERIRDKVLAQRLASQAELAAMPDSQIQGFIFRAGFSTAAAVSAVSGRGVGLDVVKTNIEMIGGAIDLASVAGRGTTFTIKIPLTLAIVSALIISAGGERFAIPQISVAELVHARIGGSAAEDGRIAAIERIDGTPVLRLRERLLPLVNLTDLLELTPRAMTVDRVPVVVAQVGTGTLGIVVDQVFDTEEIVVKPVAPILRHITMFSGNTILGDGSVIMILDPNGLARATGVGGAAERRNAAPAAGVRHSGESTPMLLFRAGSAQPMAVPLGLVARLENVPRAAVERSGGRVVTQYRGRLMPLVAPAPGVGGAAGEPPGSHQPVLVFTDRDRSMGLMVDDIVDVVDERLHIELAGDRPGLLGTAVVAGHATDIIDIGYWLTEAFHDWFLDAGRRADPSQLPHVLIVEDSDFFRHMLAPSLVAAGYRVTAAPGAVAALTLRDGGGRFDAIVSDIQMPDMDGLAFARLVRDGGAWQTVPLIALSGRADPADVARGQEAGFTDFVAKTDRDRLLQSLQDCLTSRIAA